MFPSFKDKLAGLFPEQINKVLVGGEIELGWLSELFKGARPDMAE